MKKKSLHIKYIDANGQEAYFPSNTSPAIIGNYTYNAQRMSTAPVINATLYFNRCLDAYWTGKEYVEFRGSKYYAYRTPVSSKSNDTIQYKHEITFVDERVILENVYFLDVVSPSTKTAYQDRYRSNTTKFSFMGNINEFVSRINDSLVYSGITQYNTTTKVFSGYHIVIDEGVDTSKDVEVSIEEAYLNEAIDKIKDSYELNYYWVGKVCHVGDYQNVIGQSEPLEYKDGLLNVSIGDTNNKVINRITGVGGTENIPYYYPNDNAGGKAIYNTQNINKSHVEIDMDKVLSYNSSGAYLDTWYLGKVDNSFSGQILGSSSTKSIYNYIRTKRTVHDGSNTSQEILEIPIIAISLTANLKAGTHVDISSISTKLNTLTTPVDKTLWKSDADSSGGYIYVYYDRYWNYDPYQTDNEKYVWMHHNNQVEVVPQNADIIEDGLYEFQLRVVCELKYGFVNSMPEQYRYLDNLDDRDLSESLLKLASNAFGINGNISVSYNTNEPYFFEYGESNKIAYSKSGIEISDIDSVPYVELNYSLVKNASNVWDLAINEIGSKANAVQIKITGREYITPCSNLMPSIYRNSAGANRFYNAINGSSSTDYVIDGYNCSNSYKDGDGEYYVFRNKYDTTTPHEGKQDFEDIHPTIEGVANANNKLFGEIAGIAFDEDDSDVLKEGTSDNEYLHSWFYIKLNVFSGDYGFNIFQQAIETETAKICMTSGSCSSCEFEIGTHKKQEGDKYTFINPVVTENGALKKVHASVQTGYMGDYIASASETNLFVNEQQNSNTNSIWIAVKKENSTFGVVMPNASSNYKPAVGDKFVITGIKMPKSLVLAAEDRLEKALIKYMNESNDVVTNMTVTFSRSYLRSHEEDVVALLSENSGIAIKYDDKTYFLYVTSYTCKADNDILCEITVDLSAEPSSGKSQSEKRISLLEEKISKVSPKTDTKVVDSWNTYNSGKANYAMSAQLGYELLTRSISGGEGGTATSVTYDAIIEALGYTPYNATNPNNYLDQSGASALFLGKNANAVSASKLNTAHKLWGNDFDGTQDIDGSITLKNGSKTLTISLDSEGDLLIGGNVYAEGGVSAFGKNTSGGGGGTEYTAGDYININSNAISVNYSSLKAKLVEDGVGGASSWSEITGRPTKLSDFTDDLGSSPTHTHSQYLLSSNFTKANIVDLLGLTPTDNVGTVTSVNLKSGTGVTVSNSGTAITTSGERTISISSTYQTRIANGATAYGWGNHAIQGYLKQHQSLAEYAKTSWIEDNYYDQDTINAYDANSIEMTKSRITIVHSDSTTTFCDVPTLDYLPLAGGTINGWLKVGAYHSDNPNGGGINFRGNPVNASYDTFITQQTGGTEALLFGTTYAQTAFIFSNGVSLSEASDSQYTSVTQAMKIVNNEVHIKTLRIGNAVLTYDSTNNALKVATIDGGTVNLYTTGGITALKTS